MGAQRFATQNNIEKIPICVGFTGSYREYSHLKRASMSCKFNLDGYVEGGSVTEGFNMIMGYLKSHIGLSSSDRVLVLPYFDHGQLFGDRDILYSPARLNLLSIVMIDNSLLTFDKKYHRVERS